LVEEVAPGVLDLRSTTIKRFDVAESILVVRFRIGLAERYNNAEGQRRYLTGRGVISGSVSPFRFEVDSEPEILWLDRESEVFGRFYSVDRWPKAQIFNRGLDLLTSGDVEGGMTVIESALMADPVDFPEGWEHLLPIVDEEREGERVDARIHLALASTYLDTGRLAEAETELRKAADLVKGRDRWSFAGDLLVVEARLDLLSGDPSAAYKDLKKGVLGTRGIQNRETWTLLAIAAHQVGDTEVFDQAAERAEELGVDLGPLRRDSAGSGAENLSQSQPPSVAAGG
jgi:tetratricopeptide (TPR) repeat protein